LNINYGKLNTHFPYLRSQDFCLLLTPVINSNQPVPVAKSCYRTRLGTLQSVYCRRRIVEAQSQNIDIGTPLPGIVKTVVVKVGDQVRPGAAFLSR